MLAILKLNYPNIDMLSTLRQYWQDIWFITNIIKYKVNILLIMTLHCIFFYNLKPLFDHYCHYTGKHFWWVQHWHNIRPNIRQIGLLMATFHTNFYLQLYFQNAFGSFSNRRITNQKNYLSFKSVFIKILLFIRLATQNLTKQKHFISILFDKFSLTHPWKFQYFCRGSFFARRGT